MPDKLLLRTTSWLLAGLFEKRDVDIMRPRESRVLSQVVESDHLMKPLLVNSLVLQ
jgi:hypothetical protein